MERIADIPCVGGVAARELTLPDDVVAAAMSHLPDLRVVVFDTDYRVLASYGTIASRPEFVHEALLGRRLPDVVTAEWWAAIGPVYAAAVSGRALTLDALPNGTGVILELTGSPVRRDGRVVGGSVVVRDVTELRAMQELRRQWQLSFEQAPIGIALVSTTGRFLRVNAALCRLLQRAEAELLAADFQQLTHPEDLDSDLTLLQETLAGRREFYEMHKRYLSPAGTAIHAWLSVSLVRHPDGSPSHFISQIVDLTRAHDAESQLRIMQDRHRVASDLHDHVVQGLFAAGLSLQMLESAVGDGPLADQLTRSINQIDETIARIRSTIYGLRASRGGSPVSVRDRVHDVLAEVAPLFQWPPAILFDGPLEFMVSQALLEQVVVVLRDALTEVAHRDRDDQVQVALTVSPEIGELRVDITVARDNGSGPRLSWCAPVA